MLVLSRQREEKLKFDNVYFKDADGNFVPADDFFVTITDIRGDHVRLGIDAPKPIGIDRCGPDGKPQTITDADGKFRMISPRKPVDDARPRCPACDSRLSMHIQNTTSLHCVECKAKYACPHTQRRKHQLQVGHATEVCVNCKQLMPAGAKP